MVQLNEQYEVDNTHVAKLEEVLKGRLSNGGEGFKWLFILYCLSIFLTLTTNRKVDFYAVKYAVEVGEINNLIGAVMYYIGYVK